MTISILANLPLGHGFGINTNILETNIINLSVVIGVVVTVGGDALRSLLENRKQAILNSIKEADDRANEAKARFEKATLAFESAKKKAEEIQKQSLVTAEQEKNQILKQTEEDEKRLEQMKQETVRFQQQRAVQQVSEKVVSLALAQVRQRLTSRLDTNFHTSVNNFHIVLFTNYKA
nr:ATP synthase CF0 subunit I [Pedinophyceae sp. YPF-701]